MNHLKQFHSHHRNRRLFGQPIQQSFAAIYVLEQFLSAERPRRILELGTGDGILSRYFWMFADLRPGCEFATFDIKEPANSPYNFSLCDAYEAKTVEWAGIFLGHGTQIRFRGSFLYVDCLDPKSDLVNLYSPHLHPGTVIAAHDAILDGNRRFRWGFAEDQIDWDHVKRFEPYYSMSRELDTVPFSWW